MRKNLPALIGFFVLFFFSFRFFFETQGIIGHNWDWAFPGLDIFSEKLNILSIYTWDSFNLGGVVNLTIINLLPTTLFVLIAKLAGIKALILLLLFLVTFISFIGFKKLLDFLLGQSFLHFIPSFLYAFSPFLFNDIIGGSWPMWVSYAFCPLYFINIVSYLENGDKKFFFISLLLSISIIISFQNLVLINILVLFYFIHKYFFPLNVYKCKIILKRSLLFLLLIIIINLYWIIPFSYTFFNFTQTFVLAETSINEFDSIKNSLQNLWNIFNLGGYLDRNMYLYSMPLILSFFFPFAVFFAWFFILIYFIFEKNKKDLRRSVFWLLSLLILILLIKGGNYPFSEFTLWLYQNFPFLKLFRSPQHLMFIAAFIIPILIAISFNYFYKNFKYKKIILAMTLVMVVIWTSGWWCNGDLGLRTLLSQRRDHIDFFRLPPELVDYYIRSKEEQPDYRAFFLPAVFSPEFLKTEYQNKAQGVQPEYQYLHKPTFIADSNKFANDVEISFCKKSSLDYVKYLSLFSVKDIVLRSDIFPHFTNSSKCWNNELASEILDSSPVLEKYLEGKYTTVYKIADSNFLPHFYIPQKTIYSSGGTERLADIVEFKDYKIRSAIYLGSDLNKLILPPTREILNREDEVIVNARLEDVEISNNLEKNETIKNEIPFPHSSWEPGSFFYLLVLKKEQLGEWLVRKNPEKLIDKKLFFAGKRIVEFEKWQKEKDIGIRDSYRNKMKEVLGQIKILNNSALSKTKPDIQKDLLIKFRAYLERHKEEVLKIKNLRIEDFKNWEQIFEELDGEIKVLEKPFDIRNLKYSFILPEKGIYSVFTGLVSELTSFEIDGNTLEINNEVTESSGDWVKLGESELEDGTHQLIFHFPEPDNLVGVNWQKLNDVGIGGEGVEFFFQTFFPDTKNLIFQKINNWQPNNLYYLSFDYRGEEGKLGVAILESKIDRQEAIKIDKKVKLLDKSLGSREDSEWKKFETVLKSNTDTMGAEIYFYGFGGLDSLGKVEFKNLKIQKIVQPKVILKKTDSSNLNTISQTPKITFVKINPTKYRIQIEGAINPYTLVFSENFHKGWKAYISNQQSAISNQQYGETVASYFGGDIKEGTHRNTFLEKATFETWGKKQIAEDKHLLVNGYANSWYITPEIGGGKENYEIVLEFWPQRLFYVGLGISLTALIGCLGYFGFSSIRRKIEKT